MDSKAKNDHDILYLKPEVKKLPERNSDLGVRDEGYVIIVH